MAEQPTYIFSEFCLDPARRLLTRSGEQIDLSPKAFDLLIALIENRGRVLSKDELLDRVWDGQFVEENNLAVQVSALRKAFGETSHDHKFIVTVPGKGYKFVAEIGSGGPEAVAVANGNGRSLAEPDLNFAATPTGSSITPAPETGVGSRWILTIIGITLAAVLLIGAFSAFLPDRSNNVASGSDSPPKIRQLTTKGRVGLTAISPNGEFYAYTVDVVGERRRGIWLAQTKGGQHIELRPPDDNVVGGIAFSPDGEMLYFTLGDSETSEGGLFQMPVLGGGEKKIASLPRVAFDLAPDGNRLAYYRKSKQIDGGALVVANLDGTGEREVMTRPADKSFRTRAPSFSPDGSMIAVSAVVDPEMEREEILTVDVATGETRQLTNSNWKLVQGLVWSANDNSIIAVAIGNLESLRHLWKISYTDGKAVRISSDTVDYGAPIDISLDGKSLIAEQLNIESNIWIGPTDDPAQARQVTFSSMNGAFGWSSLDWVSNDMLVFDGGIERNRAVFTMKSSGDDVRAITSGGFFDHHIAASPDGRTIVFCSDRSGRTEVWSVSFDGSDLKQITNGGGCASPDVAPDASRIFYISNREGKETIWSVPTSGGEPVQFVKEPSLDPKVSPDGRLIACGLRPPDGSPIKLAILDSQTGAVVNMFKMAETTNFNGGINWTPDGKAVTIRDWANGIWKQDVGGLQATRLPGLPGEKLYSYDWSPDGKLFAFSRGRAIADAVLLTLD